MKSGGSLLCGRLLIVAPLVLMTIMMFHGTARSAKDPPCSSSCGKITNITFPFRLKTDPWNCADSRYILSCENNLTVLSLSIFSGGYEEYQKFHVQAINYNNYTIRLVDPNIRKDDCSSIPSNTLSHRESLYPYETEIIFGNSVQSFFRSGFENNRQLLETVIFFNCESPIRRSSYVDATPCIFNDKLSPAATSPQSRSMEYYSYYYLFDGELNSSALDESCWIEQSTVIPKGWVNHSRITSDDIHGALVYGFELSWIRVFDRNGSASFCYIEDEVSYRVSCYFQQYYEILDNLIRFFYTILSYLANYVYYTGAYKYIVGLLAPRTIFGVSFVIALVIYKWRRRHLSIGDGIEEFLQNHNDLALIRYSYRDIRKMTKEFEEKLGQGGFGSVYKGKLRSGGHVAIKILAKSKANGQDFINEVASIGRIHHLNVVRLVGFCFEGSKRALVYDLMSNGSLEKYIFPGEGMDNSLSPKEIFDISLGVARGIQYLHQGCDIRILHFDIKPHNILLDENFIPKVSDFGLARLSPLDNSIVSLTAARGTMGYIAPELFYKNIGGVSSKADVYSFGMLLMEMANKRKNVDAVAEHSSQIYFPLWIYDQLNEEKVVEILENVATEEEMKTVKKMIIVALWCIQLKPCDRPSMNKVIEMLEGKLESLQMPPKPCLYPQEQEYRNRNVENTGEISCSSTSSGM